MKERVALAVGGGVVAVGIGLWALVAPGASGQPAASSSSRPAQTVTPSPTDARSDVITADGEAGLHLVFNAEFTGDKLDTSTWATCYPWLDVPSGCTNFNNGEVEWYLPAQDQVRGGALHLVAEPKATEGTSKSGAPEEYACRSGMVSSFPSFRFKYGLVKIVARIPDGEGLWSGLWLAAANEKWPPEIDMLERWGPPSNIAGVYMHPTGVKNKHEALDRVHLSQSLAATLDSGWHTFSILWTAQKVTWYVDGQQVMTATSHIPHQLMYIIANLADFKTGAGACNGQLLVRSVKVWQQPAH
jgi:beta-glucanase (GH16 family)